MQFQQASLAPSTLSTYQSGINNFLKFCAFVSLPSFPLSETVLCLFAAHLARTLSHKTIKVYLAGLQFWSIRKGSLIRISSMLQLFYVLRGIKRTLGSSRTRPRRMPISPAQIRLLIAHITYTQKNNFDRSMLIAAILTAFFGLLRVSEYTCPSSNKFDKEVHLSVSDVGISRGIASILIKASKTDPFKVGCRVKLGSTGKAICPVYALQKYIKLRGYFQGPLFVFSSGAFLTRADIVKLLKDCLPASVNINTHSFRIGGASAAASAGLPETTIKILGRWSSDAYKRYVHFSDDNVINWSRMIACTQDISHVWDSDILSVVKK